MKTKSQRGNGPFLENAETFFESSEKHANASVEGIAQLEQLVGRLTLALEIQKKHRRRWIESISTATHS